MKYAFHPEALLELKEAALFYLERQPGLETRFIDCVQNAIERLAAAPDRSRILVADVRRCLTHVFPYAILYTIETDHVLILAVMHCSREPGCWRKRSVKKNA